MSPSELIELKKGIVYVAAYYGRDLKDGVVAMMAGDLEDLSFVEVSAAYKKYRLDPKNKTMPLPAQIRDIVSPEINPDAEARELLGRVKTAITQFGYMQGEAAKTYIGEAGWQLVREQGGWNSLCCNSDFLTNDSMQAQARNRLIDIVKYGPRLSLVVDNKNQISAEEKIRLEANRQKEEFAKDQVVRQIEAPRPDPNADYIAKTPEEREAIIQNFLANIKQF